MKKMMLGKFSSNGSAFPYGIPLGTCASVKSETKSSKKNIPDFLIILNKASKFGALFNKYSVNREILD